MFALTRNERIALIVLVSLLLVGSVVSWLDKRNPEMIEEFQVVPGTPPPPVDQSITQSKESTAFKSPTHNSVNHKRNRASEDDSTKPKVNINLATAEELQTLPKIGPTMARRIIEYRSQHGLFRSLEDLAQVQGIGAKTLMALDSLAVIQVDTSGVH